MSGNNVTDYYTEKSRRDTKDSKGFNFDDYYNKPSLKIPLILDTWSLRKKVLYRRGMYFDNMYFSSFKDLQANDLRMGIEGKFTNNQFKAFVAKYMYSHPKFGVTKVCDPFFGWGGRCLGAMSLDIDYLGVDTNVDIKKPIENMFNDLRDNYKSTNTVYWGDSASIDFTKETYDFVLTSPPYPVKTPKIKYGNGSAEDELNIPIKQIEDYPNMIDYNTHYKFYVNLILPVIITVFEGLPKDKWMVFNIPEHNYEVLLHYFNFPKPTHSIAYPTKKRPGTQTKADNDETVYSEFMYCWKKTNEISTQVSKIRTAFNIKKNYKKPNNITISKSNSSVKSKPNLIGGSEQETHGQLKNNNWLNEEWDNIKRNINLLKTNDSKYKNVINEHHSNHREQLVKGKGFYTTQHDVSDELPDFFITEPSS